MFVFLGKFSSTIGILGIILLVAEIGARPTEEINTAPIVHNPEEKPSPGAYESDMILSPEQLAKIRKGKQLAELEEEAASRRLTSREKRKATTEEASLWRDGVIPYTFSPGLGDNIKEMVRKGMQMWEMRACVRFREKNSTDSDYVSFEQGIGCASEVGRKIGKQKISVGQGCSLIGVMAHELGHTLGLYHEQNRPDRDDYIIVLSKNIHKKDIYNFDKYDLDTVQDHGVPYDLGSIMHYAGWYFSKNKKLTMIAKQPDMQSVMGQRRALSLYDAKIVNIMYKCAAHCSPDIICKNHGFVGQDCSCVCPDGLTGPTCEDLETGGIKRGDVQCGGIFSTETGTITTPNYPKNYANNMECIWLIENTPGGRITIDFEDFKLESQNGCAYDYVEIRYNGPQIFGPRYCGSGPKKSFQILNDALLVRFQSDQGGTDRGFRASYKIEQTNKTPVDGGWSDWSEWSPCSSTCGTSSKIRNRSCSKPKPENRGKKCNGMTVSVDQCKLPAC